MRLARPERQNRERLRHRPQRVRSIKTEFVNYLKTYFSGGAPNFLRARQRAELGGDSRMPRSGRRATGSRPPYASLTSSLTMTSSRVMSNSLEPSRTRGQTRRSSARRWTRHKAWPRRTIFDASGNPVSAAHANGLEFLDYYLAQMKAASPSRLLDVLDVHYYNAYADNQAYCVQSPRDYWDPTYSEPQ